MWNLNVTLMTKADRSSKEKQTVNQFKCSIK